MCRILDLVHSAAQQKQRLSPKQKKTRQQTKIKPTQNNDDDSTEDTQNHNEEEKRRRRRFNKYIKYNQNGSNDDKNTNFSSLDKLIKGTDSPQKVRQLLQSALSAISVI